MYELLPFFIKPVAAGQPVKKTLIQRNSILPESLKTGTVGQVTTYFVDNKNAMMYDSYSGITEIIDRSTGDRWEIVDCPVEPEYEPVFRLVSERYEDDVIERVTVDLDMDYILVISRQLSLVTTTPLGSFKHPNYIKFRNIAVLEAFAAKATIEELANEIQNVTHVADSIDFVELSTKFFEKYKEAYCKK